MSQPLPIRFTLIDSTGIDSVALVLDNAPDGWDDCLVKWGRSDVYYGLIRSFTVPLRFVTQGRDFLRQRFYDHGVSANIQLYIDVLDSNWAYQRWYEGDVDFTTYKETDEYVECAILEGSPFVEFKNSEEIKYSLYPYYYEDSIYLNTYLYADPTQEFNIYAKYLTLYDIAYQLLDKITGGKLTDDTYAFQSHFLQEIEDEYLITTAFSLAGYDYSQYFEVDSLVTSFKDYFQAINSIFNLGFAIEYIDGKYTFIIEEKAYFYNNSVELTDLGNVTKIKISPATDLLFGKLKIGYDNEPISRESDQYLCDTITLEFEGNNEMELSATRRSKNELNLICPYRADQSGMFLIRSQIDAGESVKDAENYIFLCKVHKITEGGTRFVIDAGMVKRGINEYPYANAEISPRRILDTHANFIDSCLYPYSSILFLRSSNYDAINLYTKPFYPTEGVYIYEGEHYTIGDETRLFTPVYFEFECPVDLDIIEDIVNNYGYVAFHYNEKEYHGFVVDISATPYEPKIMQCKLLATPDTVLTL